MKLDILATSVACLAVAVGGAGAWTANRAIESLEAAHADALVWKAKAARLQEELDARPVLVKCEVGRDGTLSRKTRTYVNVKAPSELVTVASLPNGRYTARIVPDAPSVRESVFFSV